LRGWSANRFSEEKKTKEVITTKLAELDRKGEQGDMEGPLWKERYQLEVELEQILHKEELYWQQRGSEKWVLQGDANTSFFHKSVNGRRRKTRIYSLDVNNEVITSQEAIKAHVVEFYKNLFRSGQHRGVRLAPGF
jgi:hypothetical protein